MKLTFYAKKWRTVIIDGEEVDDFYNFDSDSKDFIEDFDRKFSKYRRIDRKELRKFEYAITDKTADFFYIFNLLKPYSKKMDISICLDTVYEKRDFESAEAYILNFPKPCYYYDEYPDENYVSYSYACNHCYIYHLNDKTYIKPSGGIKKAFENKFAGRTSELSEHIVSEDLRLMLMNHGIDSKCFLEVHTKEEEKLGYKISNRLNEIPSQMIYNPSLGQVTACPVCGKRQFISAVEPKLRKQLPGVRWGDYPNRDIFYINPEAIELLEDFNITSDYFDGVRLTVVNKKVFKLISNAIPEIKKRSIPVIEL